MSIYRPEGAGGGKVSTQTTSINICWCNPTKENRWTIQGAHQHYIRHLGKDQIGERDPFFLFRVLKHHFPYRFNTTSIALRKAHTHQKERDQKRGWNLFMRAISQFIASLFCSSIRPCRPVIVRIFPRVRPFSWSRRDKLLCEQCQADTHT